MAKVINPGTAIRWSPEELRVLAKVGDADLKDAVKLWRRVAPPKLTKLMNAKPQHSTEAVPDVD